MNKKQMRTLRLLLGIIAVLAAALVVVLAVKSRQADQEAEEAAAQEQSGVITPRQTYSAISYHNGSVTLSFTVNEAGEWVWADDPDFPLDDSNITAMADLLAALKPQQTITEGDTLEAYGLDQPSATLTATAADGETLTLSLGKATTDGTSYYMLMNGEESPVYIIADTLYKQMSKAIYDMCRLPELPDLSEASLETVILKGASTTVLKAARPDGEDGAVTWTAGGADVTGREDLAAALSELAALAPSRCVDYKPTDDAVSICGLAEPAVTLTVVYASGGGSQTLALAFGGQTLDGAGRYFRIGDDATIYQADADSVDALMRMAENGLGA